VATRRRKVAAAGPTHLVREEAWAGVKEGEQVDVLDARATRASWRFEAFVTNTESGESWVEVIGGRAGEERRRSFRPEQLYPSGSIRAGTPTAAPLCDAPRLAL
jgi:hypothetical protein